MNVGISFISHENAEKNSLLQRQNRTFDQALEVSSNIWAEKLSSVANVNFIHLFISHLFLKKSNLINKRLKQLLKRKKLNFILHFFEHLCHQLFIVKRMGRTLVLIIM